MKEGEKKRWRWLSFQVPIKDFNAYRIEINYTRGWGKNKEHKIIARIVDSIKKGQRKILCSFNTEHRAQDDGIWLYHKSFYLIFTHKHCPSRRESTYLCRLSVTLSSRKLEQINPADIYDAITLHRYDKNKASCIMGRNYHRKWHYCSWVH